jgi:hypothetical protein
MDKRFGARFVIRAYRLDLPNVEFQLMDTSHFALEDKADEMVPLIRDFPNRNVKLR